MQCCVNVNVICLQLERRDVGTAQSLRSAILKSEQNNPGFCYDLVASIMRRADLNVNLNEAVLRLQGNITEADREYHPYFFNMHWKLCQILFDNDSYKFHRVFYHILSSFLTLRYPQLTNIA